MDIGHFTSTYLNKIRELSPVVHNITNFVVMNSSANILLALGASPVMSHCKNELKEMLNISNALVLNIGTLDDNWIESMLKAGDIATQMKIPIILDVVGAGATQLRTNTGNKILEKCTVSVLRGNASEILALASSDANFTTKGVDSSLEITNEIISVAKKLSLEKKCIVGVSGTVDIITNGVSTVSTANGHPIMSKITGMGCGLSAVTAAFCATTDNVYQATIAAFAFYGVCGSITAKFHSNNPGSFFTNFLDTMHNLDPLSLSNLIKAELLN